MKNKTLVKSKIVLEDDGKSLVILFWKKTFWFFGYWYPFGSLCGNYKLSDERINNINDDLVSELLFENILRKK